MLTYIYLDTIQRDLVKRRLKESTADESFILVCNSETYALGQQIQYHYCSVKEVCTLENISFLGQEDSPPIVLPLSFEMRPLVNRPSIESPFLVSHYPVFRKLWAKGFREVEIYSLAGTRRIALPLLLDKFHNQHYGKRCFVVGNGPSLNRLNMTKLRDEITLGSNQCYLGYREWGFSFTYWGISDQFQIETYGDEYEKNITEHKAHFVPFEYCPYLYFPKICPVNQVWCKENAHQFSDIPDKIYRGYTVTYMLLQIAAVMGCNPIILVGVDHNYPINHGYFTSTSLTRLRRFITRKLRDKSIYRYTNALRIELLRMRGQNGEDNRVRVWDFEHVTAPTHFTDKYTMTGQRKFALPEPGEAESDFMCAKRWAEQKSVNILNATPDSKLKVFENIRFEELF